jgi:hypothetical protein
MALQGGSVLPADGVCRDALEVEAGRGFCDGLEVEREALGCPSRGNPHG